MKRTPIRRMKVATILTDPKPSFVSLVDHGANQTPFSVIKMALTKETDADASTTAPEDIPMADNLVDVRKITFDKAVFTDEDAVKAYLKKAGFDAEPTTEDDLFVVSAGEGDDELVQIEAEKGVTYYVVTEQEVDKSAETADGEGADAAEAVDEDADAGGEAAKENDDTDTSESAEDAGTEGSDAQGEDVAKSFVLPELGVEEVATKYDTYWAQWSDDKNLSEVLREGADGLPIGIYELNDAFYTALRNNLVEGDYAGARAVVTEFGELVIRLTQALEVATVAYTDVEKAIDEIKTPEGGVDAEDAASEEGVAKQAEGNPVTGLGGNAAVVAMLSGMAETMKKVEGAVQALSEDSKTQMGELTEKVDKTTERVDGLENRTQTRRGADVGDAPEDTAQPTKVAKAADDPLLANTLGFRRRN